MSFSSDPIGQLFFSLERPTTSEAVFAVLVLDTEPDIALLRRKLAQMAERFRKLKSRWNGSRWNACPFDVDEHFFVHRLQSNTTEETLEDVSSCYSEPLDFGGGACNCYPGADLQLCDCSE